MFHAIAWGDRIRDEQLDELLERVEKAKAQRVVLRIDQFRDLVLQAKTPPTEEQRIHAALRKLQFTNGDVSINGHSIGGHWNKHLQGFIDEVEAALYPQREKS